MKLPENEIRKLFKVWHTEVTQCLIKTLRILRFKIKIVQFPTESRKNCLISIQFICSAFFLIYRILVALNVEF